MTGLKLQLLFWYYFCEGDSPLLDTDKGGMPAMKELVEAGLFRWNFESNPKNIIDKVDGRKVIPNDLALGFYIKALQEVPLPKVGIVRDGVILDGSVKSAFDETYTQGEHLVKTKNQHETHYEQFVAERRIFKTLEEYFTFLYESEESPELAGYGVLEEFVMHNIQRLKQKWYRIYIKKFCCGEAIENDFFSRSDYFEVRKHRFLEKKNKKINRVP